MENTVLQNINKIDPGNLRDYSNVMILPRVLNLQVLYEHNMLYIYNNYVDFY